MYHPYRYWVGMLRALLQIRRYASIMNAPGLQRVRCHKTVKLSNHIEDNSLGELPCRTAGRTLLFSLFYAVSYFSIPCTPHSQIPRLHPINICVEGRTKEGENEERLVTAKATMMNGYGSIYTHRCLMLRESQISVSMSDLRLKTGSQ